MGAKIQGREVSGTPVKFTGYFKSSYPEDFATPAGAAGARRPPRKRSAARFDPSEPSETFSGVFWSFPTPRKRSAAFLELSDPSETFSGVF